MAQEKKDVDERYNYTLLWHENAQQYGMKQEIKLSCKLQGLHNFVGLEAWCIRKIQVESRLLLGHQYYTKISKMFPEQFFCV